MVELLEIVAAILLLKYQTDFPILWKTIWSDSMRWQAVAPHHPSPDSGKKNTLEDIQAAPRATWEYWWGLKYLRQEFVCHEHKTSDGCGGVNVARHGIFRNGKVELDKLVPTLDSLHLLLASANRQAKIWMVSDKRTIHDITVPPEASKGWIRTGFSIQIVWATLPPVPMLCWELVTYDCPKKYKSATCSCSEAQHLCAAACGCNAEQCCNPTSNI